MGLYKETQLYFSRLFRHFALAVGQPSVPCIFDLACCHGNVVGHRDHLIRNMAVVLGLFEVLSELRIAFRWFSVKEMFHTSILLEQNNSQYMHAYHFLLKLICLK